MAKPMGGNGHQAEPLARKTEAPGDDVAVERLPPVTGEDQPVLGPGRPSRYAPLSLTFSLKLEGGYG